MHVNAVGAVMMLTMVAHPTLVGFQSCRVGSPLPLPADDSEPAQSEPASLGDPAPCASGSASSTAPPPPKPLATASSSAALAFFQRVRQLKRKLSEM
eukprot:3699138-Alexandrium_andersonii.AAC.1